MTNYLIAALLLLYHFSGVIAGLSCSKVAPSNGKVVLKFRGRIAKFSCNPGFVLDGDKVATCIEGRWDAVPRCVHKIQCRQVKEISNGSVMLIRQRTIVKFTCNLGYKLIGSAPTVSCSDYSPIKSKAECIPDVKLACDFEDGLCGWENDRTTGFLWLVRFNATPSHALKTGPSGDHTTKDGHYMYIETSGMNPDESHEKVARLYSPLFSPVDDSNICFTFWYHMYGYSIGTLNVYLNNLLEFTQSGDLGNLWRKGVIKNLPTNRRFQIVIEATAGNGYAGDIAIDDVAIVNSTDCIQKTLIETTCEGRCFESETNSSLCQCSSECIIEASCCADFMNFCSYESSTRRANTIIEREDGDDNTTKRAQPPTPSATISSSKTPLLSLTNSPSLKLLTKVLASATGISLEERKTTVETLLSTQEFDSRTESDLYGSATDDCSSSEVTTEYSTTELTASISESSVSENLLKKHETSSFLINLTTEIYSTRRRETNANHVAEIWSTESVLLDDNIVSTTSDDWDISNADSETQTIPPRTLPSTAVRSSTLMPSTRTSYTKMGSFATSSSSRLSTKNSTTRRPSTTEISTTRTTTPRSSTTRLPAASTTTEPLPTNASLALATTITPTTYKTTAISLITRTSTPAKSPPFSTKSRTHLLTSTKVPTRPIEIVTQVRTTQFIQFIPKIDKNPKTKWTSVYKPKGHYTYSAAMKLESDPKTITYLGVTLSLLIIVTCIVLLVVRTVRRRRLRVVDGTEEADVLFMTSDEALDFSIARRPLCENNQQQC